MKTISAFATAMLLTCWALPGLAEDVLASAAVIEEGPTQLVLVPSNTWLYAAPSTKAHKFRIMRRVPSMKRTYKKAIFPLYATARPRRVLLFQLAGSLSDAKGWAHLKPVADDLQVPNRCDFLTPGRGLAVHLYVRSEALLSTLKEPFLANFEQGTGVELKPGVVIRPTKKKGRFIAETPYLQVDLPLPPDATAKTYAPQPGFSFGKAPAWAKGPVKLKINDEIKATLFGVDIGLRAEPVKQGHGRWLMNDIGSCAKVTGVGRYRPLGREPTAGVAGVLGMIPDDAVRIAKGSRVMWPDGKVAGQTERPWIFEPKEATKSRAPNHRCFKKAFFSDQKTVLCFLIIPDDAAEK